MREFQSELNTRQWELYKLIKDISETGEAIHRRTIQNILCEYYPLCNVDNMHNDSSITMITRDIQKINNSSVIQKVIISSNKGLKLASDEDYEKQLTREKIKILSMLKRNYKKFEKISLNNQKRLQFNKERELIESLL